MKLTAYDKGGIMSAAKDVTRCMSRKEALIAQKEIIIEKAQEAQAKIDEQIAQVEGEIAYYSKPVIDKFGYQPLELVQKIGKAYQFIYPDVLPPVNEHPFTSEEITKEELSEIPVEPGTNSGELGYEPIEETEELEVLPKKIGQEEVTSDPIDDFNPFN